MQTLLTDSIVIESPVLKVWDYVTEPELLNQWVPVYGEITERSYRGSLKRGDWFETKLALFTSPFGNPLANLFPGFGAFLPMLQDTVKVHVDDLVHGRRIAYRADIGWTTLCDFRSLGGATHLTMTQSMWSLPALFAGYITGPLEALYNDIYRQILAGLKRRLEGWEERNDPQVFFSYRRSQARHVGGRIYDALAAEFGEGIVFRDVNSLVAGGDWAKDIEEAINDSKVVVVHIGDGWEDELVRRWRENEDDGLRVELEIALEESKGIRIVPVLTSNVEKFSMPERMRRLEKVLEPLKDVAPGIVRTFTEKLQMQRLREDPDFSRDLEGMMRAVWTGFRKTTGAVPSARSL